MRKLKIALVGLVLFSLTGCANSRLRKDFVGFFKRDFAREKSPFEKSIGDAGESVADGVNRAGSKFDDLPVQERSGQAVSEASRKAKKAEDAGKETLDKAKDKTGDFADWTKKTFGCK